MYRRIVTVALMFALTSGCEGMDKEKLGGFTGGLLGAVGGAAAGSTLTKDKKKGMVLGAFGGGLAGYALGTKIGQYLNEQDRKKHQEAVSKAFETGETQVWTNPETGNSGKVTVTTPVSTPTPPPAQAGTPVAQPVSQSPLCRTTTQTIKLKNGETHTEELKACKGSDGTWEAVGA